VVDPDRVRELFRWMREAGDDTTGPLLWRYFFSASELRPLHDAADKLVARGYRLVGFDTTDTGPRLEVERAERHSETSLIERLAALDAFGKNNDLAGCDAFDVGPADGGPFPDDMPPVARSIGPRVAEDQTLVLAFVLAAVALGVVPYLLLRAAPSRPASVRTVDAFGTACARTTDCPSGSRCEKVCTRDANGNLTVFVGRYCRP